MTNDGTTINPQEVAAAGQHDDENRASILSRSVLEFIFSEVALKRAVKGQLPPEVAAVAALSFASFDEDRKRKWLEHSGLEWLEDDVRVAINLGLGLGYAALDYVSFTIADLRNALTELLLPALRDRYTPVIIQQGWNEGCASCGRADLLTHVHVRYVIRRDLLVTPAQRAEAWEVLTNDNLLEEPGLVERNALGLEMIKDGAAPGEISHHLISWLAEQSVAALPPWSGSDRERVGTLLADYAAEERWPDYFRESMEAFRSALAS